MRKMLLCSMLLAGCHDYAALSAGYDKLETPDGGGEDAAVGDAAVAAGDLAGRDLAQASSGDAGGEDLLSSGAEDFSHASSDLSNGDLCDTPSAQCSEGEKESQGCMTRVCNLSCVWGKWVNHC